MEISDQIFSKAQMFSEDLTKVSVSTNLIDNHPLVRFDEH